MGDIPMQPVALIILVALVGGYLLDRYFGRHR